MCGEIALGSCIPNAVDLVSDYHLGHLDQCARIDGTLSAAFDNVDESGISDKFEI